MTIQGPQGTGDRFKKKVTELKAKYNMSDLKARRRVAGNAVENQLRREGR